MCEYKQREYSCGHFMWLASKHCTVYKTTKTKNGCLPDITCFEKRTFVCGECRPKDIPVLKVAYESKACQACCQS